MKGDIKSEDKMNNLLVGLVVVVILVSIANFSIVYYKTSELKSRVTGYLAGYVNVTISTSLILNISRNQINFSTGIIYGNSTNCTMYTRGDTTAYVAGGNFSTATYGMIIQNTGSTNFSLAVTSEKNASSIFGTNSTTTGPEFQLNATEKYPGTCGVQNASYPLSTWDTANETTMVMCTHMTFTALRNEMYLDARFVVPLDTPPGAKSTSLTITAYAP